MKKMEKSFLQTSVILETPPSTSDAEEEDEDCDPSNLVHHSTTTHTVTFKCIGSTMESSYQEKLACVAQLRNLDHDVPCHFYPEPDNPYDSLAIAFKCEIDEKWHTIGYVRPALKDKQVTSISIDWVKFIIFLALSLIAGIKISRIGEWSRAVVLSQSARM